MPNGNTPLPRPPRMPSPFPVDLEGNVRLGVKTLVALLVAVVTCTITLVKVLPTKSDLEELFTKHEEDVDAHGLFQTKLDVALQRSKLEELEETQEQNRKDFEYIRTRIDFLTEQQVVETVGRRKADEAVQKLRKGVKPSEVLER